MAMNVCYEAAIWVGMALLASVVSIRVTVPVALVEIVVGALAGNIPGSKSTSARRRSSRSWPASIVLTFVAGAEIDPVSLRRHWKASATVGVVSCAL